MNYQDCVERTQAGDAFSDHACWSSANINPRTGLATEYLNHFNEAVMLLELLPTCPECLEEFLAWRPLSYRKHFARSRLQSRDLAIAAYGTAAPSARDSLDALAAAMTEMLAATRAALTCGLPRETAGIIAVTAAAWLKPLIARTGAVINGVAERAQPPVPQAAVDRLMRRNFS